VVPVVGVAVVARDFGTLGSQGEHFSGPGIAPSTVVPRT
jgi:hypothetical protein